MSRILIVAFSLVVSACATTSIVHYPAIPAAEPHPTQKVVVIIDGTSNDPRDRTNPSRIHELISNQNRSDLAVFYTEGVGSHGRIGGMATGWGMAKDVRDAYRFIAETWRPGGDIYLVGFSRGAFGARVLAGLIYSAGVINLRPDEHGHFSRSLRDRKAVLDRLYDAYLHPRRLAADRPGGDPTVADRRTATATVVAANGLTAILGVRIRAEALWDTVEAMGVPDGTIDPFAEGKRPYLDQFCNVDHVFHAMSLDDDRAFDFTPIFATAPLTLAQCDTADPLPDIREVWFSGAHADVGGTYADEYGLQGHLPGVSLNWMIAQIETVDHDLLPAGAAQYANPYDMVHDSQQAMVVWRMRPRAYRTPLDWAHRTTYNGGQIKIHHSVEQRMAMLGSIDDAFSEQCFGQPRAAPPLRCARALSANGFLRELIDAGCVAPITSDHPERGYQLIGARALIPDRPEVRTHCVTVVYDTMAQRDAFESRNRTTAP